MSVPPSDFLKYLTTTIGEPANIIAASPLHYNADNGNLYIDQASDTKAGYLSTGNQTIAGQKTFLIPPLGIISSAEYLQSSTTNTKIDSSYNGNCYFNFRGKPTNTNENKIQIFGLGDDETTDTEYLQIGYTPTKYEIKTQKNGTGSIRNIEIACPSTYIIGNLNCSGTIYGTLSSSGSPVIFNFPIGGAIISPNLTGTFNKVEGQIFMNIDEITNSSLVSSTIYTVIGAIPIEYRPSYNRYLPLLVYNNSAVATGTIEIRGDGLIQIYVGGNNNFSSSGNAGVKSGTITYFQ